MLLYAIKVKADGRYFVGTYAHGGPHFNKTSPQFWKTPDAIAKNLKRLCSDFRPYKDRWGWWQKGWENFDETKLDLYQVIKFKVLAFTSTTLPASKFVSIENMEDVCCDTKPRYEYGT